MRALFSSMRQIADSVGAEFAGFGAAKVEAIE